ncbi:MAG: ABC transporter ATP-binding protein [Prevotella sp.]|nr:ABC transporter ATP-binding protein [Prevotella sp.]
MNININNLKKSFGDTIACDIDNLTIHSSEIFGMVGNNGAGKTTLFRLILDLIKADEGTLNIGDINPAESEEWKNVTGAYIDESFLIEFLTPEEYFSFIGKVCGIEEPTLKERLTKFERFMNGEVTGKKKLIRDMSAGNKQKVGIIAAMLNEPEILILDEPFNFLDPSGQSMLKRILKEYNATTGATIIISSHNLSHTIDISSRIALLEHGRIIKDLANDAGIASQELTEYFENI